MIRHLEGVDIEEIVSFCKSLTVEKKYLDPLNLALQAEFVTGVKVDNDLAGIGGIRIAYRLLPHCFFVVKSEFQGKGIGYELSQTIIRFARNKHSFLALSVHKENASAINLYQKSGFEVYCSVGAMYWMFLPFNKRGTVIGKFLPVIVRVYFSPVIGFLRSIRCFFAKNRTRQES